jgi:hypothetical protein
MEAIQRGSEIGMTQELRQQLQGLGDAEMVLLEDGQWLPGALEQPTE